MSDEKTYTPVYCPVCGEEIVLPPQFENNNMPNFLGKRACPSCGNWVVVNRNTDPKATDKIVVLLPYGGI